MTQREIFLLGAITLLGAGLRLYLIGAQSLWFDELLSLMIARLPLQQVLASPASIDPPLYYVLLHFWMQVSHDDAWTRMLSALPAIATVPALYVLGARLWDRRVGLIAALIFAIGSFQIFYAQEARMYSWLVLFSTLAVWSFVRTQDLERARDWVLWATFCILAIYAHAFAGLLVVALDVEALLRWRAGKKIFPIVAANIAIAVGILPYVAQLVSKWSWLAPALFVKSPTVAQPLFTLTVFVFGTMLPVPYYVAAFSVLILALTFIALAAWRVSRAHDSAEWVNVRLLLVAAFVPVVLTWLISQWKSVYLERLMLESSPAFYVLLAWGIAVSAYRRALRVCALIGAPLLLFALYNYFFVTEYHKPPLRDVIAFIAPRRAPGEPVIHTSDSSFLAGRYYDPSGNHVLLYHPADQWLIPSLLQDLDVPFETDVASLARRGTFWVMVALDHVIEEQLAEKKFFDGAAVLMEEKNLAGVGIYRYTAK